MICIKPIAPLGETACTAPKLSARMTPHIQAVGMPKRYEASSTNALKRVLNVLSATR
jgi:hypothetical protein